MLYKLLGMAVWKGARWYLSRRVGSRALVVGGVLALGIGVAAVLAKHSSTED